MLSFAALSIVGVGAVSSTVLLKKNTARFLPSCSSDWGRTLFQASSLRLLVVHSSRSFDRCLYNTGASSQCSWPVPRPVVLNVLALFSWCCRSSRGCSCFMAGGYSFLFTSGYSTISQFQAHLLRVIALVTRSSSSCGRWFLTHWRYPQSALGRWCLRLLVDWWPRPTAGWQFVSRRLCSPSQT